MAGSHRKKALPQPLPRHKNKGECSQENAFSARTMGGLHLGLAWDGGPRFTLGQRLEEANLTLLSSTPSQVKGDYAWSFSPKHRPSIPPPSHSSNPTRRVQRQPLRPSRRRTKRSQRG